MAKTNQLCQRLASGDAAGDSRVADPVDIRVGRRLRDRRTQLGLTMTAVASALGIARGQVSKYEQGINRISPARLVKVSELLDVSIGWFFQHEPDAPLQQRDARDEALAKRLLTAFRRIKSRDDQMTLIDLAERLAPPRSKDAGKSPR
ncbi:MAG: helix-turn-helix transcriptional regulator [Hyphomicrobium sp.]